MSTAYGGRITERLQIGHLCYIGTENCRISGKIILPSQLLEGKRVEVARRSNVIEKLLVSTGNRRRAFAPISETVNEMRNAICPISKYCTDRIQLAIEERLLQS